MADQDPDEVWVVLSEQEGSLGADDSVARAIFLTQGFAELHRRVREHVTCYIHADRHAAELAEVRSLRAEERRVLDAALIATRGEVDEVKDLLTAARQRILALETDLARVEQLNALCPGCGIARAICDNYGPGRKCCPDCKHEPQQAQAARPS